MSWQMTDTTRPLTGDFDPKNFLDQVETVDTTGRTIPEWRRHVLAKHAAEKAQKEFEERRVVRSSILQVGNKTNLRNVSAMAPVKKTATTKNVSLLTASLADISLIFLSSRERCCTIIALYCIDLNTFKMVEIEIRAE